MIKNRDISTIYRVSMSIDTIYNIDNRLIEISANWKYRRYIGDISVWGRFITYISAIFPILLKIFKKIIIIFEVGVSL